MSNLDKSGYASDVCACGDYRDQHDAQGCKICRWSKAPYDHCEGFRFSRPANHAELEARATLRREKKVSNG